MQTNEHRDAMLRLIERTPLPYLGTLSPGGEPRIKVVTQNQREGMTLFRFVTLKHRQRTQDILHDGRACLYFADNEKFETLRLDGIASITRDKALRRSMWNDGLAGFFQQGVDDPEFSIIEFRATGGNYYNYPLIKDFVLDGEDVIWKE